MQIMVQQSSSAAQKLTRLSFAKIIEAKMRLELLDFQFVSSIFNNAQYQGFKTHNEPRNIVFEIPTGATGNVDLFLLA